MITRPTCSMLAVAAFLLIAAPAAGQSEGESSESSESESSPAESNPGQGTSETVSDSYVEKANEESEHGEYDWKRSFGAGVEFGQFFTGLRRWNRNLLEPNDAPSFEHSAISSFTVAAEASLLEGSRLTVFGTYESPFSAPNPNIGAAYAGLEPAFAFRRNNWSMALGLGLAGGTVNLTTGEGRSYSAGLFVLRPSLEVRHYLTEAVAGYARVGFNQWIPGSDRSNNLDIVVRQNARAQVADEKLLQEGSLFVSLGARFGKYPEHVKVVPDSDGDGFRDDVDDCPEANEDFDGYEDGDGCPDKDNDSDDIPDDEDECPNKPEDIDDWNDHDGCPDPDNDNDGIPDEEDNCPDEAEDDDQHKDRDGCPDTDNDDDGITDGEDECPKTPGIPLADGCPSDIVSVEEDRLKVSERLRFRTPRKPNEEEREGESLKTELTDAATDTLDHVAETILLHDNLLKVEVRVQLGTSDDEETERTKAKRRAEGIVDYLVQAEVPRDRLRTATAEAESETTGTGTDGEASERSVEFLIAERGGEGPTDPDVSESADESTSSGDDSRDGEASPESSDKESKSGDEGEGEEGEDEESNAESSQSESEADEDESSNGGETSGSSGDASKSDSGNGGDPSSSSDEASSDEASESEDAAAEGASETSDQE